MTKTTLAREEDGTIQITLSFKQELIEEKKNEAIKEMAKDLTVSGFRKGKVPLEVAKNHLDDAKLTEHALQAILPKAFSDAIKEHNLKPAVLPRFEIVSKDPWQIKAITCEINPFELGNYKKIAKDALKSAKKEKPARNASQSDAGRENKVIEALLASVKVTIPKILTEEEVNSRLSSLLSRLEKLGLSLENYLASIKKTAEDLRHEYLEEANKTITLELILNKIAEVEKVKVDPKKVEEAFMASAVKDENQKYIIESILKKRAVLDSLVS